MTLSSLKSLIPYKSLRLSLGKSLGRKKFLAASMVVLWIGIFAVEANFSVLGLESGTTIQVVQKPFIVPSDEILKKHMKTPMNVLLKDIAVPVNDDNYQAEVFESDRPVMVLFSAYPDDLTNGLGTLVKVLHENYPEIKVCHYDLRKDPPVSRKEVLSMASRLRQKYPIRDLPYLIFYRLEHGVIVEMPGDYNFIQGIGNIDRLKYWIMEYGDMPKSLFKQ